MLVFRECVARVIAEDGTTAAEGLCEQKSSRIGDIEGSGVELDLLHVDESCSDPVSHRLAMANDSLRIGCVQINVT